ncbi:MAG: dethiobiotin synthase [Candidatus Margulisiibacteriota bacterium]
MSGVFITGTDTGCGKTYVTVWLARYLRRCGLDIGVMKPISTGSARDDDARFLKNKLKLKDPLRLINPIHLKAPLAPLAAAKLEKRNLKLETAIQAYRQLKKRHGIVLIEGIGGVLVPITGKLLVVDLIKRLKLPAIIVARAGLGTINHTLLTVEALRRRNIPIMGIIINGYRGKDRAEKSNAAIIERLTNLPVLAQLPWR